MQAHVNVISYFYLSFLARMYYIHCSLLCPFHLIICLGDCSNSVHRVSSFFALQLHAFLLDRRHPRLPHGKHCGHPTDSCSHLLSINSKTLSPPFPTPIPFYWLVLPTSMSGFCMLKENVPFVVRTLKAPITSKLDCGVHSLHPQLPFHPCPLLDLL